MLDEEVDSSPAPEAALLPRVLGLLSSFPCYLDVVVRCTRKTELRSWRTLFDYLPPPQELFEESLQRGSLKTAGGYLLVLHTFDDYEHGGHGGSSNGNGSDLATAMDQSVRLLARAMAEGDWELCKELARFLAALDESGNTLRSVMQMLHLPGNGGDSGAAKREDIATRLAMPPPRQQGRVNGAVAGAADGSNRATTQLPGGDEESTPSEGSAPLS